MKNVLLIIVVLFISGCLSINSRGVQLFPKGKFKATTDTGRLDKTLHHALLASQASADRSRSDDVAKPATAAKTEQDTPKAIKHRYSYRVKGNEYHVFKSEKNFQAVGTASWYGPGFHGNITANGERYNMQAMTAAHKTLPFDTRVLVTNLENGLQAVVRINDRGPFHQGRIIDLSKKAAQKLGLFRKGHARVHLKTVEEN